MKATVDRKEFLELGNKFVTRGKRRSKAPIGYLVTKAIVIAKDSLLTFHGCDSSFVIYSYFSIESKVEEEGTFMVDGLDRLFKDIKKFSGKELTINSNKRGTTYICGRTSMTEPIEEIKSDMELDDWVNIYNKEPNDVYMLVDKQKGVYKNWFTINGSLLKDIEDMCLNTISSDKIELITKNGVFSIRSNNDKTNRTYETSFEVEDSVDATIATEYIFAILSQLSGKTTFYYYITKSGRLRIIVNDGKNWWYCRYDKTTNS